jgi:hypothetical protein
MHTCTATVLRHIVADCEVFVILPTCNLSSQHVPSYVASGHEMKRGAACPGTLSGRVLTSFVLRGEDTTRLQRTSGAPRIMLRSRWLRTERILCRPPLFPDASNFSAIPSARSAAALRAVRTAAGVGLSPGMRTYEWVSRKSEAASLGDSAGSDGGKTMIPLEHLDMNKLVPIAQERLLA